MVFSSLLFLFRFLPLVLAAYYILPKKCRNLVLFVSSLFFYAWGEPVYVVLILFSSLTDYLAGRIVAHFMDQGRKTGAKAAVFCSALINLSLLGFFKYADFFVNGFAFLTGMELAGPELPLPVGISFYTFQTMSYTIDVYRNDAKVQKNFIAFGAYVALFPQLIAGPVIRYKTVAEQLHARKETVDLFCRGIVRFIAGLGKKVLIANQLGMLWEEIAAMDAGRLTTAAAWLGVLAFTFEIYFDFSGYSDMAIGLGAMFGFSFPENFHYPYESKSITEFWRRWHISLGTWFREYVYIPLGGGRRGVGRQMINISIVWLLTGLWHGAHWNFVLWGAYYGILLAIEKMMMRLPVKLPAMIGHMYTMAAVMLGWGLFSWQDMADGTAFMKTMFLQAGSGLVDTHTLYLVSSNLLLLIFAAAGCSSLLKRVIADKGFPEGTVRRGIADILFVVFIMTACVAMLVNSSYNPFLYFRF